MIEICDENSQLQQIPCKIQKTGTNKFALDIPRGKTYSNPRSFTAPENGVLYMEHADSIKINNKQIFPGLPVGAQHNVYFMVVNKGDVYTQPTASLNINILFIPFKS